MGSEQSTPLDEYVKSIGWRKTQVDKSVAI